MQESVRHNFSPGPVLFLICISLSATIAQGVETSSGTIAITTTREEVLQAETTGSIQQQAIQDTHPAHPSEIIVSADDKNQSDDVYQLVSEYELQTVEQWVFDGSFQHLRYSIDPAWYGELPRSYFFKQDQSRLAASGQLHQNQLVRYFAQDIKKSGSKTL